MRIDVVDLRRLQSGHGQGVAHGDLRTGSIRRPCRQVIGIGRGPIASENGKRFGTACASMAELFDHQHRSAFGEHKSIMTLVKGSRRLFRRIGIGGAEGARGAEAADGNRIDRPFGATNNGNIRLAGQD